MVTSHTQFPYGDVTCHTCGDDFNTSLQDIAANHRRGTFKATCMASEDCPLSIPYVCCVLMVAKVMI